jgi:hypothetical protein
MSEFGRDMVALQEGRMVQQLEDKLNEKKAEIQQTLEDAEGVPLHQAQGAMKLIKWMLDLPGEILREAKNEDQTTEE